MEDVEDGFIDGLNDMLPFIKENVTALLKAASPPSKVGLVVAMGVP